MKFQMNKFINDRKKRGEIQMEISYFLILITPVYHYFSILEQTEARQVGR